MRTRLYPIWTWLWWVLILPLGLLLAGFVLIATTRVGTSENVNFERWDRWWLLACVPAAGLIFLLTALWRRRALRRFTSEALAPLLAGSVSADRQALRAGLVVLAVALLAIAAMGPQWGVYIEEREVYGVDIVVAFDVSRSMLARDLVPNRLTKARREVREQLTERSVLRDTSRLGLLAFAGSTSMKVPLTLDHAYFRDAVDRLDLDSAPRGGTELREAIYAAADFFSATPDEAGKIVLLVTDGEDHSSDAAAVAKEVYEDQGVKVFAVGVGDPASAVGAEVPRGPGPGAPPLVHEGQVVISRLDVAGLRAIAKAGGGRYASIRDLNLLVDAIGEMHRSMLTTEERRRLRPRYQWFLAGALLLLLLETVISERRRGTTGIPTRVWQQEETA